MGWLSTCRGSGAPDIKKQTELYDTIAKLRAEITDLNRKVYEAKIEGYQRVDSILQEKDKILIVKHENIPVRIRAINNNADLHAAGKRAAED